VVTTAPSALLAERSSASERPESRGENDALRLVRPTEASEHNRGAVSNRSHRTSRSFPRGQGVLRRYQWRPLWMPRYDRLERSKPRREPSFEDTVEPGSGGYLGDVGL
jgi:hypothetical protein